MIEFLQYHYTGKLEPYLHKKAKPDI